MANAVTHADKAQHLIGLLPSVTKSTTATETARTFAEFRKLAEKTIGELRDQNAEMHEQLDANAREHAEQQQQAETRLQDLSQTVDTLKQEIETEKQRLDASITDASERFSNKQTERDERFAEWLTEKGTSLEELARPHVRALETIKADGQQIYEAIDQLRDSTENVASVATGDALARHYGQYSRSQWWSGLVSTGLGIAGLVVGALVVIETLNDVTTRDLWQLTILKLGLTLTIVGAAAVAIRVGTNFLSRAHASKEVELELRAIGPFLADVDQQQVEATKTKFVERRFGQPPHGSTASGANTVPVSTLEQVLAAVQRSSGGPQQ